MLFKKELPITNGLLRVLAFEDLHQGYVDGLNNPAVNQYLEVRRVRQTTKSVGAFIKNNIQSSESVLWGIWSCDAPNHVRTIRIHGINNQFKHCHIGICTFCETAWGRNIGTNAIIVATNWAFSELGMSTVEAHAYLENVASVPTFIKAGYLRLPDRFKIVANESSPIPHAVLVKKS